MKTEYLSFSPRLKNIIDSGQSINKDGDKIEIGGSISTLNNIRIIREIILKNKCKSTLEIGLAYGGSALAMLSTLKEVVPSGFYHSAIDPFQNNNWRGSALRVIDEEGFSENFTHYNDFSAFILPELVKRNEKYDLIYIDGSHLFEDVFIDFYYSTMLLAKGGILLFDDCTDKHVKKVIKFIQSNYSGILENLDFNGIENPNKSLKQKIGNKLGIRQMYGFIKSSEPPREWDVEYENF